MSITAISRDWGVNPSIVRIVTTDSLATITTAAYITGQSDEIEALNFGAFEWLDTDTMLISYSNGEGLFTRDSSTEAFVAQPASPGTLSDTLASGTIFVGSAGNAATSVAMSGDTTITNAGVVAIGASKVLSAMISPLVVKYAAVTISAAQFNGAYAAPKLLVAAGGANTMIILHRVDLLMTYVSANYAAGGVTAIQYDSTANGAGVIASTTLAAATFQAAASTGFMFNTGVVAQTFTTCANKGLYLSNITGAFTTGDSTFVAHVYYSIVPTV